MYKNLNIITVFTFILFVSKTEIIHCGDDASSKSEPLKQAIIMKAVAERCNKPSASNPPVGLASAYDPDVNPDGKPVFDPVTNLFFNPETGEFQLTNSKL